MPIRIAFWRNEPIVRFVSLAIFAKGVFAREWIRNSFSCALVYPRRTSFF
jgi:hypothetical protein